MALLVVSGATGGHVRAIDRSAVLHMCEDELGVTTIARMSTELCSCVMSHPFMHEGCMTTTSHSLVLMRAITVTPSSSSHIWITADLSMTRS